MSRAVKAVKKAVKGVGETARKIIPNEVADVAVKAAPFVAPFNPLLAGGMAALGSYDQTGSFGRALKSGLFTYGGGQLARGIGGAGFQTGYNPFGGLPSGSFGIGSLQLGASPIGTQTGLKLGQYKMFGGPGSEVFKAQQEAAKLGTAGDLDLIAGPGGGIEEYLYKTDPSKLTLSQRADIVAQQVSGGAPKTGYKNILGKIISPDATLGERTAAIKELGGKALKDIYTTKDGSIDKLAVGATIAGATSYMEAKKLAEEAELVEEADQYTEEMYEADKARYDDYYKEILPYEAFGIRAQEAEGGLLSLRKMKQDGSVPEEFISYTDDDSGVIYRDPEGNPITKAEAMKAFSEMPEEDQILMDMEGKPLDESEVRKRILPMPKPKEFVFEGRLKRLMEAKDMLQPESFEYLLRELKEEMTESGIPSIKLEKKANGGRVGFQIGGVSTTNPQLSNIIGYRPAEAKGLAPVGTVVSPRPGTIGYRGPSVPEINQVSQVTSPYEGEISRLRDYYRQILPYEAFGIRAQETDEFIDENENGIDDRMENFKKGGRVKYAMGSEVPVRQNEAGTKELDYRQSGGFVPPIGIKEKADDIPAMLSNNEFVFTADAVRAAGGGSVNKGAQKMYALMKQLEGKVV